MSVRRVIFTAVAAVGVLVCTGCVSTSDTGGWVIIDQPEASKPPPPAKTKPPGKDFEPPGKRMAAENHIRSAYRFLQKNKPDHALKELQKARQSRGNDFWVYYYSGGAYYFKGMYRKALEEWEKSYRYTGDYSSRSRLRTCQSYAVYRLEGENESLVYLKRAVDLDEQNHHARILLKDLESRTASSDSYRSNGKSKPGRATGNEQLDHSRYVTEKIKGIDTGAQENSSRNSDVRDTDRFREGDIKDDAARITGPGRDRKTADHESKKPKKGKKSKDRLKLEDQEQFKAYFLIEISKGR